MMVEQDSVSTAQWILSPDKRFVRMRLHEFRRTKWSSYLLGLSKC